MIELTKEQIELINKAVKWYKDPSSDQVFEYTGAAGTGKSLVMHEIIKRLGLKSNEVVPMAYTGAAALVMRRNGFKNARTIHSTIYKFDYDRTTGLYNFKFVGYPQNTKLICIDEASMVGTDLKHDIENTNIKILVCGDLKYQLPPINSEPAYLVGNNVNELTIIMRQARDSAIVQLANSIKNGNIIKEGTYNKGEVIVITKKEFDKNLYNIVRDYGLIICGWNKTRDKLNNDIRHNVYGYKSPLPLKNERLICRKNNWFVDVDGINLVNGLCGICNKTIDISSFEKTYFTLDFKADFLDNSFSL